MMADAAALRDRATRRLGEIMEAQRRTVGLSVGGRPPKTGGSKTPVITLAEIGIDKDLAKQARKFAALPKEKFEALVERRRLVYDIAEPVEAATSGRRAREANLGMVVET